MEVPGRPDQNSAPQGGSLRASVPTCLQELRPLGTPKAETGLDGVTLDLGRSLAALEPCGSGGPCLYYGE